MKRRFFLSVAFSVSLFFYTWQPVMAGTDNAESFTDSLNAKGIAPLANPDSIRDKQMALDLAKNNAINNLKRAAYLRVATEGELMGSFSGKEQKPPAGI